MGMQNINDLFEAYVAEEDPIKKEFLLNMYNHALQQKQQEVISRDFVRETITSILNFFHSNRTYVEQQVWYTFFK